MQIKNNHSNKPSDQASKNAQHETIEVHDHDVEYLSPMPEEGVGWQSNVQGDDGTVIEVPEDLSPDDKIEFVIKQITKVSGQYTEILTSSTIYCGILGTWWLKLQEITKPDQFSSICKRRFPLVSKKMRTRYMRIAKKTDLKNNPSLAVLGQARLLKLATKTEEFQSIEHYLTSNKIDFKVEIKNKDAVGRFKNEVDKLFESEGAPSSYTMNTISTQFNTAQQRLQRSIDFITCNPKSIEQSPKLISSALEMIQKLNQIIDLSKSSHK